MSGSSLDGVDIACCTFQRIQEQWTFAIEHADCIAYTNSFIAQLKSARTIDSKMLCQLDTALGRLYGEYVVDFIERHNITHIDAIASHGHTVFHFPGQGFTTQIGCGATIAAVVGLPVVADLRSADVALGGQGTPIVPIGDKLLFPEYNYLLNIGGIANITVKQGDKVLAFDICAANQILNYYAEQCGKLYDEDGKWAATGALHTALLDALNGIAYYKKPAPKSLDNGFSKEVVLPIIEQFDISMEDKLYTYCHHIAEQIKNHIADINPATNPNDELLITGGGAFHKHLVKTIGEVCPITPYLPTAEIIQYKEALVIALMGVLRMRNEINVLSSVTGAKRDNIGGAIYVP